MHWRSSELNMMRDKFIQNRNDGSCDGVDVPRQGTPEATAHSPGYAPCGRSPGAMIKSPLWGAAIFR